jgi:hypothetical protein
MIKQGKELSKKLLLMVFAIAASISTPTIANTQGRSYAGTLVCIAEQGWTETITSKKEFRCTFSSANGEVRGHYSAEIQSFKPDVRTSGNTVLMWQVSGPPEKIGENYEAGELEGFYTNDLETSEGNMQIDSAVLVGFGPRSFLLRPISVQVETGLSVAVGVEKLVLTYVGPIST